MPEVESSQRRRNIALNAAYPHAYGRTKPRLTATGVSLAGAVISVVAVPFARAASIGDVFVIPLENHNFTQPSSYTSQQQILGNTAAPYINSLITPGNANAANVSYATNYTNSGTGTHPSEPNYIWSEAGTNYNPATNTTVLSDNDPSAGSGNIFTLPHLTGLMNAAGISWKNYQEDYQISGKGAGVSASGTLPNSATNPYNGSKLYDYAAKHDPMAFFSDTASENLYPISQLSTDLTNNTVARYNWITPDLYNEMHSSLSSGFTYHGTHYTGDQSAVAEGDNFLSIVIPQIEASAAFKNNGLIVIWDDETEGGDTTNFTIPEIIISPLAKGNAYASSVPMNHSSDLKTMQEIFGLGPTFLNNAIPSGEYSPGTGPGTFNTVSASNDLSSMFRSGVINPLPIVWAGGTGNWTNAADWLGGVVPSQSTVEVQIDHGNSISSVVSLDANQSVADVILDVKDTLSINAGRTLTLNGPATSVFSGSVISSGTIAASSITVSADGAFMLQSGGTLSVSSGFTNQGTTSITGSQSWSPGSVFNNSGGSTTFARDTAAGAGANLTVNALGGSVTFSSTQHLAGLNLSSGATASLTGGSSGNRLVLVTPILSIAGTLDLTSNALDLQGGGAAGLAAITALVRQGYNSAGSELWIGTGITSSTAATDTTNLTALGVIQNYQSGSALYTTFDGVTPGAGDVLVKFTYYGDTDLNGEVDGSDYSRIDNGYLTGVTGWFNGDFNYDGVIDGSDYTLIDNAFNTQGPQLSTEIAAPTAQLAGATGSSSVPEPLNIAAAIALAALLGRKRKRRRILRATISIATEVSEKIDVHVDGRL